MKLRSRSFSKYKNGPLLYKHNMIGPKSQSVWPGAFLHLTPEPDFSQTCTFTRIINVTVMHDLNPKNLHINGVFFLTKSKKNFFFFCIILKMRFFLKNPAVSFFPWHTDILTYWQWWNHRTLFAQRSGSKELKKKIPKRFWNED